MAEDAHVKFNFWDNSTWTPLQTRRWKRFIYYFAIFVLLCVVGSSILVATWWATDAFGTLAPK